MAETLSGGIVPGTYNYKLTSVKVRSDRCADCRFWEHRDLDAPAWGHCDLTHSSDGTATHAHTSAFAIDTEEHHARLMTRSDFGCVQFDQRPVDLKNIPASEHGEITTSQS